jgi:hypothetical protein
MLVVLVPLFVTYEMNTCFLPFLSLKELGVLVVLVSTWFDLMHLVYLQKVGLLEISKMLDPIPGGNKPHKPTISLISPHKPS